MENAKRLNVEGKFLVAKNVRNILTVECQQKVPSEFNFAESSLRMKVHRKLSTESTITL
jgi:hypothetical protein